MCVPIIFPLSHRETGDKLTVHLAVTCVLEKLPDDGSVL